MKIKSNFILKEIAGSWIAMPVGAESTNLKGVLTLNSSGVLLWNCLEQGCDIKMLSDILVKEYDIDITQATEDATAFVDKLRNYDCLE